MGGAVSAGEDNDELIDNLVEADYIKSPMVEKVFRAVDRADYYADGCKESAYRDLAWKQGNLHLSAPCIYSEVLESLLLEPGLSFLNLGSGTGYLSTVAGLILGPNGVNHGVELHRDVVEYAQRKVSDFLSSTQALDEHEFCEPHFVMGNCLAIDPARRYDRVYCGASCPPEHCAFIKNLVKIGGILVMPFNDQLVQIKRTGENAWLEKNILPVSFAMLVQPSSKEKEVSLPDLQPISLQELSRSRIRRMLRSMLEKEHPSLSQVRRCTPAAKKKKQLKRRMQRIVIPIFEESDDSHLEQSDEERPRGVSPAALEHVVDRPPPPPLLDDASSADSSPTLRMEVSDQRKRAAEDGGDHPAEPNGTGRRTTSVVWKRVAFNELDLRLIGEQNGSDSTSQEDEQSVESPVEVADPSPSNELSYSTLMRHRISALPLPHRLKVYLNFSREL